MDKCESLEVVKIRGLKNDSWEKQGCVPKKADRSVAYSIVQKLWCFAIMQNAFKTQTYVVTTHQLVIGMIMTILHMDEGPTPFLMLSIVTLNVLDSRLRQTHNDSMYP